MANGIPQIVYVLRPPVAFAGQLADTGNHNVLSAVAETAFDAGLGVIASSTDNPPTVDIPASSGETVGFLGVSLYVAFKEPNLNSAARFAIGDPVPVVNAGRVWVQVDATGGAALVQQDASHAGSVYLVNAGAQAGKFRQDTGAGGTAANLIKGAVCRFGGTAGGVAMIELNQPSG